MNEPTPLSRTATVNPMAVFVGDNFTMEGSENLLQETDDHRALHRKL